MDVERLLGTGARHGSLQSGFAVQAPPQLTSKVDNVRSFLNWEPAGRYEIEALTRRSLWLSHRSAQQWGFAIKHDDGRVELQLADGSRHTGSRLGQLS